MPDPRRLLILGGTAEAAALARLAAERLAGRVEVISSLAGRIPLRQDLPGRVRVGGFGGVEGLAGYLGQEAIDWVVDATHPFAARISAHAAAACGRGRVPRLMLVRPPWRPPPGSRWHEAKDLADAARLLPPVGRRAFLTVGSSGIEAFAGLAEVWFLVRTIAPPALPLPLPAATLITARPPYPLEGERRLLAEHRIDVLVTKQSGGGATEAKIVAAAEIAIPIIAVRRPPATPGEAVETVDDALAWLEARL